MKELVPGLDKVIAPAVPVNTTLVCGTLILNVFVPGVEIVITPAVEVSTTEV